MTENQTPDTDEATCSGCGAITRPGEPQVHLGGAVAAVTFNLDGTIQVELDLTTIGEALWDDDGVDQAAYDKWEALRANRGLRDGDAMKADLRTAIETKYAGQPRWWVTVRVDGFVDESYEVPSPTERQAQTIVMFFYSQRLTGQAVSFTVEPAHDWQPVETRWGGAYSCSQCGAREGDPTEGPCP